MLSVSLRSQSQAHAKRRRSYSARLLGLARVQGLCAFERGDVLRLCRWEVIDPYVSDAESQPRSLFVGVVVAVAPDGDCLVQAGLPSESPAQADPCFCGDSHDDEPRRVVVEADPCEICCEDNA